MQLPEHIFHEEEQIIQVKIPMSGPLRWVNSYLWKGDHGVAIVDPGPHSKQTEEEWYAVWDSLFIEPKDITDIVLTHHHPDHYGLAGWMQERTGAKVWMSQRAHQEAELMWGKEAVMSEVMPAYFQSHGMTDFWAEQLPAHLDSFIPQVMPSPVVHYIEEGMFEVQGRTFQVMETAGHAPGHLSFYEPSRQLLLCGDAVLPQISPNVSLLPGSDPEPLFHFLEGLERIKTLAVCKAFPGHRHPMNHLHQRIDQLKAHHEDRLIHIEEMLTGQPRTGFDICLKLFGEKLGIHQMRFAMAEALAHLQELVRQERVYLHQNSEQQYIYYRK